jgi:hypothetical protein
VINNESGWYEGWMIHDYGAQCRRPRDGHAQPLVPAERAVSTDTTAAGTLLLKASDGARTPILSRGLSFAISRAWRLVGGV